jgi:hypothetical protein
MDPNGKLVAADTSGSAFPVNLRSQSSTSNVDINSECMAIGVNYRRGWHLIEKIVVLNPQDCAF